MKIVVLVWLAAAGLILLPADADVSLAGGTEWGTIQTYLAGEGSAYGWANTELTKAHKLPLFCVPEHLGLGTVNFVSILDDEIAQAKFTDDAPVDYLLLLGFQRTFACK